MSTSPHAPIEPIREHGLVEHRSLWADALRAVSNSWRIRAQAGRLGDHSLAGALYLASLFDDAAALLDYGSAGRGAAASGPVHVQDALRASEERFRLLVDSVTDYAIFILDPEGHIATWNAGAERIKGWRAEEIVGRPFTVFYRPDDVARGHPAEELKIAAREGRYREEGPRLKKDGTEFWAEVTITALRDSEGRLQGFAKVTRDLTERRRAEKAVASERDNFKLLVQSVRDYAIFMLDPDGRVATWNDGARHLKGYEAEEIIGQHFSRFYPPDERHHGRPERELTIAIREGAYHEEGWRLRKDGSRFWADVTLTALFEDGELRGFAKVTRDLTERVKQEHALREANAGLERRVKERTDALVAVNEELEAFSYSVSHDLRAPLRAIEGFSKVVLEDYGPSKPMDEKGRTYLERIRTASHRMATLIDDLVKLSRVSRDDFHRVPVDLSSLAREVVEELRQQDPRRTVAIVVPPEVKTVGEPRLLRLVLQNLLGNAWKFTRKSADARIEFGVQRAPGEERFFVRDNGAGFDPTYADKLFTPFQRLHDEDEFEGTGIGLATVQRIVRRHGGRVWAEGQPEQGATFWFTLVSS